MARAAQQPVHPPAQNPAKRVSIKPSAASMPVLREALNMRIHPDVRSLIDHAAELAGKTRTDFVLDAARQAAEDTLLDQTRIVLGTKAYSAFVAMLEAPPRPNQNLRKTMQTPPVWTKRA